MVLKKEKKLEVLEHPLPNEPARNAINAQREAFDKKKNDSNDVILSHVGNHESRVAKAICGYGKLLRS